MGKNLLLRAVVTIPPYACCPNSRFDENETPYVAYFLGRRGEAGAQPEHQYEPTRCDSEYLLDRNDDHGTVETTMPLLHDMLPDMNTIDEDQHERLHLLRSCRQVIDG
jgi:hypothetical protein